MYSDRMFAEKVLEIFRVYVEASHSSNMSSASRALGLHITTLEKWLKGTRDPGLCKIGPVMDMLGVRVLNAWEQVPTDVGCVEELTSLRARVHELETEVGELRSRNAKIEAKYEAAQETLLGVFREKHRQDESRGEAQAGRGQGQGA